MSSNERQHDELQEAVVFQNLQWEWSFYGLTLLHFAMAGSLSVLVLLGGVIFGYSLLYGVAFFAAISAGLAIVQWRKPADYIPSLLSYLAMPRHLTCLEDDVTTWPFAVAPEELTRPGRQA
ncbi:hypothetical protein ACFL6C_02755 [Myxococcota bacterium]